MNAISQVEYDDKIIQVKLLNVEKKFTFCSRYF